MSDDRKGFSTRRFGRKDRKKRLESGGEWFPDEDDIPKWEPPPPESEPLPFDSVTSADEVDGALDALSRLDEQPLFDEFGVPFAEDDALLLIPETASAPAKPPSPVEERFPPIKPELPSEQPQHPVTPPRQRGLARQDRIAIGFFLATIALLAWFITIWNNPQSALNPLAPPTPYVVITSTPLPVTPTDLPTVGPTPTFTPLADAGQGLTAEPPYPFALAATGVMYIPNDNGKACNWASIAGTVTGLQGDSLNGYGVRVKGDGLDEKVFSGTAQTFGPGGFEMFLNGVPQQAQYTVQLFSPTGAPLSDEYTVITSAECDQNVALVNFVQLRDF